MLLPKRWKNNLIEEEKREKRKSTKLKEFYLENNKYNEENVPSCKAHRNLMLRSTSVQM